MIIKELPSGTIDLELIEGTIPVLQFNANCIDALPYCQAMCCRLRNMHNCIVEEHEAKVLQVIDHPDKPGKKIIDFNRKKLNCVYQQEDGLCSIHTTIKPKICKTWHCSPRGELNNPEITMRDRGFAIVPLDGNKQDT